MIGSRRSTGSARAAMVVALALALLGPGLAGSPSPGGVEESRSTSGPPSVLFVNLNETTCLSVAQDGKVFTGSAGGGLAEWTSTGTLSMVSTSVGTLPSNHVVDLADSGGITYAITASTEPSLVTTGSSGSGWSSPMVVNDASGPLTHLRGGDQLLVLDSAGAVFVSETGALWERPDLPSGVSGQGWLMADLDDDVLALSNGTDVELVDLESDEWTHVPTPPINDLALDGGALVVASDDHPDVYHMSSQDWLDASVISALAQMGSGWVTVRVQGGMFQAATIDGIVIEANVNVSDPGELELRGSLDGGADMEVADMALLADGTVLLATNRGTWVLDGGEARPFAPDPLDMPPSNDVRSVAYAGEIMWAMTESLLFGLAFDSKGNPSGWLEPHEYTSQDETGPLDAAYLGGTVYIAGFGGGVSTYDTFHSSKPTRWGGPWHSDNPSTPWNNVTDVEVVDGFLYLAGPYGLDVMVPDSDPPRFTEVDGAPDGVTCLSNLDSMLLVGTRGGVWTYLPMTGDWDQPSKNPWSPEAPITGLAAIDFHLYATSGDTLYWYDPDLGEGSRALAPGKDIGSIDLHESLVGPVWATADDRLLAMIPHIDGTVHEPGSDGMGGAVVRDVAVGPHGIGFVATDSGVHRVEQYGSVFSSWTTSNGLSANDIRDLAMQPDTDDLWIGAYGGVDVMDTTTFATTRIGTEDGLPSNLVYDILFDDEAVWVGTDVGGAARKGLPSGEWLSYDETTGLVAPDVQALARTDELMLFGTDEGITILDFGTSSYNTYTASSTKGGLPDNWVWCALADDGSFYAGTWSGLGVYDPGVDSWSQMDVEGIRGVSVRSLALGEGQDLWVGTDEGVIILSGDGEVRATVGIGDGLPGDQVLSMMVGSDGWMWVGTSGGVALVDMDGSVHATFTTENGLVHSRVQAIAEHPEGTMWLGTAGGLSKLEKRLWHLMVQFATVTEDLPDVYVADIIMDPDVPTVGGVVTFHVSIFNPSSLRAITGVELALDDNGSPGETISSALAYTEPGGSYSVELNWTAVGGAHTLWVIVDPEDRVPETDEGNNVVAISFDVNRPPVLGEPTYEIVNITRTGSTVDAEGNFTIEVVYSDPDWDPPMILRVDDENGWTIGNMSPIAGSGDLATGKAYSTTLHLVGGLSNLTLVFSDGIVEVNRTITIPFRLEVRLLDPQVGYKIEDEILLAFEIVEPYHGTGIEVADAFRMPLSWSIDDEDWPVLRSSFRVSFQQDVISIRRSNSNEDEGPFNILVWFADDQDLQGYLVIGNVTIVQEEPPEGSPLWLAAVGVAAVVTIAAVIVMRRRGEE